MMWETVGGAMMTKVKWFYHPQEIETCGRKFDLKLPVRLQGIGGQVVLPSAGDRDLRPQV